MPTAYYNLDWNIESAFQPYVGISAGPHLYFSRNPIKGDATTINLEALKQVITADRAAGYHPICIIGSAGTVNTGAIDDLNAQGATIGGRKVKWVLQAEDDGSDPKLGTAVAQKLVDGGVSATPPFSFALQPDP